MLRMGLRIVALGLITATGLLASCTIGANDERAARWEVRKARLAEQAAAKNVELFSIQTSATAEYDVAVLRSDGEGPVRLVVVPGAPSEHIYWTDFAGEIRKDVEFYALERPGYGASGPGEPVTDLKEQSAAVVPLFKDGAASCNIVMGSSYGAAIALLTALDHPDRVDGVIVSSGLIVAPGRRARTMAFLGSVINPFVRYGADLGTIRREIVAAPAQRRKIMARLDELNVPVVIVHGDDDEIVPISNAYFLRDRLEGVTGVDMFVVEGAGHGLMSYHSQTLFRAVDTMIERMQAGGACLSALD